MEEDFLDLHKKGLEHSGFWEENFKSSLLYSIELQYKTHIIRRFSAVDLVINGDKVLVKWIKRMIPLSDEDLKNKYDRT